MCGGAVFFMQLQGVSTRCRGGALNWQEGTPRRLYGSARGGAATAHGRPPAVKLGGLVRQPACVGARPIRALWVSGLVPYECFCCDCNW